MNGGDGRRPLSQSVNGLPFYLLASVIQAIRHEISCLSIHFIQLQSEIDYEIYISYLTFIV